MSDYKNPRPLPSASASDPCVVYDNSVSFDKLINESQVVTTYKGVELQSVPSLLEQIEAEANATIISLGWHQVGLFADGFTYTLQNDIAKDAAGDWYRWNGSLPKVVTAGALPSSDANFLKIDYKSHLQLTDTNAPNSHPASAISNDFGVSSEDFMNNILTAESFGSLRNTATLQAAVDAAISSGKKVLTVNDNWIVDEITNKGQVSFVGSGSVTGLYRKRVAKLTDPVLTSFNDINPEVHLKRFLSKDNPVVVVVGDSLATGSGANIPYIDSLYSRLIAKIKECYPEKNIAFHNRAIGGETYFSSTGLPVSFPTWYTNTSRAWPLYVGELQPDLVIFNFGMNDGSNLHTNSLQSYQHYFDDINIFPSGRPDVIYCTNLTPAIDTTFANLGSPDAQYGRDIVAGYTRSFANNVGAGLLDFHRQCTIVKDGYDPTDTYLEYVGAITPINGAIDTSPYFCTDFKIDMTLTLGVGEVMAIRLGAPSDLPIDPTGRGSYAVIYNVAGLMNVDFFTADVISSSVIYAAVTSSVAIPSGQFVLTVEKKQNTATFYVNGNRAVEFNKLRVAGGDAPIKAGNSTYTTGNIVSANFWVGRYKTFKQSIVNNDMWGESDNRAIQREPFGGNGANHPSTIGSSAVFQPVLDNANFSGTKGLVSSALTLQNGWRNLGGFNLPRAYRNGNLVTIHFHVKVPTDGTLANGVVLNAPAGFRPPAGASAFILCQQPTGDPVTCTIASNGDIEVTSMINNYFYGTATFTA